MKKDYLRQAWLVLVLAVVFSASLAGIDARLAGRIEANKLSETIGQIPLLVPGSQAGRYDTALKAYRATDAAGELVGWVVPAGGQGFADKIELLIGLDKSARKITGLYVLDQKETPGLGNRITEADWQRQFVGLSAGEAVGVTKSESPAAGEVRAVTGATISSESVAGIVNATMSAVRDSLAAAAKE